MAKQTLLLKLAMTGCTHKFCQTTADKDKAFLAIEGRGVFSHLFITGLVR